MKVSIQRKIEKDLARISDESVLESFYKFVRQCIDIESIYDISQIKKISGGKNYYRYRIRDYRVWLRYEKGALFIERILHRKDIYKIFP